MRCYASEKNEILYNMKTRLLLWKLRILDNALSRGIRPQTTHAIYYSMLLKMMLLTPERPEHFNRTLYTTVFTREFKSNTLLY